MEQVRLRTPHGHEVGEIDKARIVDLQACNSGFGRAILLYTCMIVIYINMTPPTTTTTTTSTSTSTSTITTVILILYHEYIDVIFLFVFYCHLG